MPLLDGLADDARAIGAVNTLMFEEDGRIVGHNTDWSGFLADLQAIDLPLSGRDCLVLGAGGSARAIVYALIHAGAAVQVLARRVGQAESLAADLSRHFPDRPPAIAADLAHMPERVGLLHAPFIVNTTPLGMTPAVDNSPWPAGLPFPRGSFAYDLVYNPAQTRFLAQAAADGCRTANGLGMLVAQAAESFALWTRWQPNTAIMRQAAESALAKP
jgi:shikimate dehydrogenase